MKTIKNIFGAMLLLCLLALIVAPWKQLAATAIHSGLALKGYPDAQFTLENIALDGMVLRDVSFGKEYPLVLDRLEIAYSVQGLKKSSITITRASAHFQGGTLATQNAMVAWAGPQRFIGALRVHRVPLDNLLKLLTGNKTSATGAVSGDVPLVIFADNSLSTQKAKLQADNAGVIMVAPDVIPGDNAQVALVRNVLGNFHYHELSLALDSGADKKFSIVLQLSGNNPEIYDGREVKLNVHLTGDLLGLIEQHIRPIADPKQWLKQDEHEKR